MHIAKILGLPLARAGAAVALFAASAGAHGQGPAQAAAPAGPKVYALVSAVGSSFHFARETMRTGSRLDYYRRSKVDAPGNVLDRIVLQSLDREVALVHPGSKRIYLAVSVPRMDGVARSGQEDVAIANVIAYLKSMPQWERVVTVIGRSIHEAIVHSALAGKVDVRDVREVRPGEAGK